MNQKNSTKFTIVIPAYNEEKTVRKVVMTALKVKDKLDYVEEVILVNDGCTDQTVDSVSDLPIKLVCHKKNLGYTAALLTGIKNTKTNFVLIVDADWQNITAKAIISIMSPILNGKADLVKASFNRARGRVTNFAVKPMMKILYPEYDFEQPISGQFAGPTEFLRSVKINNSWGVAIGILLEALKAGIRVVEVDIGKLIHKANSNENIAEMSRQVLETIIQKAGLIQNKYKLVVFTLDETLIKKETLSGLYRTLGIGEEARKLQNDYQTELISFSKMITGIAKLLKGISEEKIRELVWQLPLTDYSSEVVKVLVNRKFKVAIISPNFSPIVLPIAERLGIDKRVVDCVFLEKKDGKLTGHISQASKDRWIVSKGDLSFIKAFKRVLRLNKAKASQVIMLANNMKSLPLNKIAGMSIACQSKDRELKKSVDKTIKVLAELLALVE